MLDTRTLLLLAEAIEAAEGVPENRLIVLRGEGRAFSAGVDVGEHLGDLLAPMLGAFERAALAMVRSELPTLVVAHGAALGGGCELVALADLSIAAEDARLGCPEIGLGCVPPVAIAAFPRLVGAQRAAELVLTGAVLSGAEAARIGLVTKALPADRLDAAVEETVARFSSLSASAIRLARRTARAVDGGALERAIREATALSVRGLPAMRDATEGLRAFLEKRAPVFTHR